jgi:hypothetical protein
LLYEANNKTVILVKKKVPSGGYRKNAKRPLKYGEPTESVPVRVPKSKKKEFKEKIKPILKKWEVKKK